MRSKNALTMIDSKLYTVVVPVYNTTKTHELLYERLNKTFKIINQQWELVLVDDCSPNVDTWVSLQDLASEYSNVRAIRLMRNFGRGPAILCAMSYAKGDYIITMDDDLQQRPEDIPLLIEQQSHDVVVGQFTKKQHSIQKRITSNIKSWVDYVALDKPKHVKLGSLLLMNQNVARAMLSINSSNPFFAALLFYVTRDVVMVPVHHDNRVHGKSEFNFWRRLKQFSLLLINNSTFLPKVLMIIGGVVFSISTVVSLFVVFNYIFHDVGVPGWTSLIIVTLMLGGTTILGIGLLGEYLGRIFASTESRPPYLVREVISEEVKNDGKCN